MKIHLLRPNEQKTMCGLKRGQFTTNPDSIDCLRCISMYAAWRT